MLHDSASIIEALRRVASKLGALVIDAGCPNETLLALIESGERLKDACAAAQARATHEYSERLLAGLTPGSVIDQKARRELGGRIGRARRVPPFHGGHYLELSRTLVRDLPHTLDALADGRTNEYRASLVANAAACLGAADRAVLDADPGPRLDGKGDRAVRGEADRIAAELDAAAVVERHRRAVAGRRVTTRPAPDAMVYLTALLPVADGVVGWAALDRHASRSATLPIRQIDHVVPHARGGSTSLLNTSGLCARCNLTKAARRDQDVLPGPPPPPPRSEPWPVDRGRDHAVAALR